MTSSKIAGNDYADVHVRPGNYDDVFPAKVALYMRHAPDPRAMFAMKLVERWGLIMGDADGEDSAGRQKGRRLSPQEVADLACDTAEASYAQFQKRGWLFELPGMDELRDLAKDIDNSNG